MAQLNRQPSARFDDAEDDHLNDRDYAKISNLVGSQVGIKLPPAKRIMVEGRLRKRIRSLGFSGFDAYCDNLFTPAGMAAELPFLINAVTTNKTDFFREPEHFEC